MMKRLKSISRYLWVLIFIAWGKSQAQDSLKISLLTCGTGTAEVYQAYGHTGIRVQNYTNQTDSVYNYGMFNFNEDGFILKFIQGKLLYFVATEDFKSFMSDYLYFGRSVREQVLHLNTEQKNNLNRALQINALPENRYYLYDFVYNNCSTQPRDLIRKSIGDDFHLKKLSTENTETIREMVDQKMKYNEWLDFGIDLLLGVRFDKVADADTRMFLPEELMMEMDSTEYHGKPIVESTQTLYAGTDQIIPKLLDPTLLFWIILIIVLLVQIFVPKSSLHSILSMTFLSIAGIVGWILVFMWWGTDHYMTKWNMNLLWANPLFFPFAYFLLKQKPSNWIRIYMKWSRIVLILLFIFFPFLPQQFHSAVIPILLILIWSLSVHIPLFKDEKQK